MLQPKVGKDKEQHLSIVCVKFQRDVSNRIWITSVWVILAPKRFQRCRACVRDFQNSITLGLNIQKPNPSRKFGHLVVLYKISIFFQWKNGRRFFKVLKRWKWDDTEIEATRNVTFTSADKRVVTVAEMAVRFAIDAPEIAHSVDARLRLTRTVV